MNSIETGLDLTERWRLTVAYRWGDDGQNTVYARLIEHHDYDEDDDDE